MPLIMSNLSLLPSELLVSILEYLPIASLLAFGPTSKSCHELAHSQLRSLRLAVMSTKSQTVLALTNGSDGHDRHDIARTTGSSLREFHKCANPELVLERHIRAQNKLANEILSQNALQHLRSLTLMMYDLQSSELGVTLATNLPKLRHLELNFYHPYVTGRVVGQDFWTAAPKGTPCWNALAGLGKGNEKQLKLRGLLTLRIVRAGLTSTQLKRMVMSNPGLRELHLSNVTGVEMDFVDWLARYCQDGAVLQKVSLTNCATLGLQKDEDWSWVRELAGTGVKHLSMVGCKVVRQRVLNELIESDNLGLKHFQSFTTPQGDEYCCGTMKRNVIQGGLQVRRVEGHKSSEGFGQKMQVIEVDPAYLTVSAVAA